MKKLLVVDDETDICEILEASLDDIFGEIDTRNTLDDGLEIVKQNKYDLIILDVNIRGKNGGEVISLARTQGALNFSTPILVISGFFYEDFLKRNMGKVEMMKKPFSLFELKDKVNLLLSKEVVEEVKEEKPKEKVQTTDFLKNLTKK